MIVFVRALPARVLSPNGGTRDKPRTAADVVDSMYLFGSEVYHAVLETQEQPYPQFACATISLTFYIRHGAQGRCPRCRGHCQCYRPRTPSNFGGDTATPILDALVRLGILGGKTWTHVDEVRLRIREAAEVAGEGVLVEVTEATTEGSES